MLAKVLITQVHSHSCTFFSHVPCYVREHTVEEHHRTHSHTHSLTHPLTHIRTCSRTYTRKKKKIDSQLYSWRQNRTFVHTNEFPTFYPHSHILSTKFPTFLGQLSTFFRHFSTRFPHFLASFPHFLESFPHFTNIHICAYIHKNTPICSHRDFLEFLRSGFFPDRKK